MAARGGDDKRGGSLEPEHPAQHSAAPSTAAMTAGALPGSSGVHSWHWEIAGNCENMVPYSMAIDKAGF